MEQMKKHNRRGNPIVLIVILILVPVFILSGLQFLESTGLLRGPQDQPVKSNSICWNGTEYMPRLDLTVILLAGIDETGKMESSGSYNNPGEADMVALLVFDKTNKKMDVITLNRDTMMEIPVLGVTGQTAGTKTAQLALAHTYGTGLRDSSRNLSKAVSQFLCDVNINYYITLRMDAIGMINDAVGGVEVDITEDFSAIDPSMTGKIKLNAQQAQLYIQSRRGVGDELNLSRMQRQDKYMRGFMSALLEKIGEDENFVTNMMGDAALADYMLTDCSAQTIASLCKQFKDYEMGDIVTFQGTNKVGEYMEFHVTEDQKYEVVMKYLYAPR